MLQHFFSSLSIMLMTNELSSEVDVSITSKPEGISDCGSKQYKLYFPFAVCTLFGGINRLKTSDVQVLSIGQ